MSEERGSSTTPWSHPAAGNTSKNAMELMELFGSMDMDASGSISPEEFKTLLENPKFKELLQEASVATIPETSETVAVQQGRECDGAGGGGVWVPATKLRIGLILAVFFSTLCGVLFAALLWIRIGKKDQCQRLLAELSKERLLNHELQGQVQMLNADVSSERVLGQDIQQQLDVYKQECTRLQETWALALRGPIQLGLPPHFRESPPKRGSLTAGETSEVLEPGSVHAPGGSTGVQSFEESVEKAIEHITDEVVVQIAEEDGNETLPQVFNGATDGPAALRRQPGARDAQASFIQHQAPPESPTLRLLGACDAQASFMQHEQPPVTRHKRGRGKARDT